MADNSKQEFLEKTTGQLLADIAKKQTASMVRAHPTPQQKEEQEQEKLRKIINRFPASEKASVDFDALERSKKAQQTKREGKILPNQVIVGAQRMPQPEEFLP